MMTRRLAQRALQAAQHAANHDHLRMLTLTNLSAGIGFRGGVDRLIRDLPLSRDCPTDTAFLLAMALHARTQDDFFPGGRTHVGVLTLAPALALSEKTNDRLFQCLAAGYEVMCIASAAYSAEAQQRGLRPSGVFGPLGAAASAAMALEMDEDEMANAIGLAAAMAGGTNQSWIAGTDEWILEVGAAARAGVDAAQFGQAGAVSADAALEGPAGWGKAYFEDAGAPRLDEALAQPLPWIQQVAHKPYPVSGIAQVTTHLACQAHQQLTDGEVDGAVIYLSKEEASYPGTANRGPFRSRSSALMSVAFCVSCGLADGVVRLERLEAPNEPEIQAMLERVRLEPDAALGDTEGRLAVWAGGRTLQLTGSGHNILYPTWETMRTDTDGLAARSEASAADVRALCDELSGSRPQASRLRSIVQESVER